MHKFINEEHEKAYNLMLAKEFHEAQKIFDNLIYLFPKEANLFGDRGVNFIHLKKKEEALKDFDEAVFLESTYGYRYASRAYAKDFFGDTSAAILDYQKAIELDPEDAVSYNNIGLLQEKMGYQQKAKQNFDAADLLAKEQEDKITPPSTISEKEEKQPETDNLKKETLFTEFFKVLRSKKQFKEFISFLKKGGKMK